MLDVGVWGEAPHNKQLPYGKENMKIAELEKVIELHCDQLMEHVECVQILVSRCVKGKTEYSFFGKGNIFARQGMAKEFIDLDVAHTLALELNNNSPDDGDDWKGK